MKAKQNPGKLKRKMFPYMMLLPYFILYLSFSLVPILATLGISLTNMSAATETTFVGLENYITLFADQRFWKSVVNIMILTVIIVPLEVLIGLIIASILTSRKMIGCNVFRLLNFLPYLMASVATGLLFKTFFGRKGGTINMILQSLHLIEENIYWTGQEWPARIMLVIVILWKCCGYTAIFFIAGINNISTDIYEAAELDGVTALQKLVYITLPNLHSILKFVVLTTLINTLQLFDEPYMLFSNSVSAITAVGGPNNAVLTPMWMLYDTAFGNIQQYGYGSTVAYALFMLIVIFTFFINHVLDRKEK